MPNNIVGSVCSLASFLLCSSHVVHAKESSSGLQTLLPPGAKIIETADLRAVALKPRMMVLWMLNPSRNSGGPEYCGTSVHGAYYEGPTRLSLVDASTSRLLNTVKILGRGENGVGMADRFQIPYLVSGAYWRVPHLDREGRGGPEILDLRDYTGEGIPAGFVLFMYDACGIVSTSVLGYERSSDRVVQYQVDVSDESGRHREFWVGQVFATKPARPGAWAFNWRPGHGSDYTLNETVSFDSSARIFRQKETVSRPGRN